MKIDSYLRLRNCFKQILVDNRVLYIYAPDKGDTRNTEINEYLKIKRRK